MTGEKLAQWSVLCTQAADEKDIERFLAVVKEIERLLEEKRRRLTDVGQPA
jgi:hypothetical protein